MLATYANPLGGSTILTPRWYQNDAVQSVFDYYASGATGNPLICMPTGTGKSIVIGELAKRIMWNYPTERLLMSTHVKELIRQNAEKLMKIWPDAPLGIHSAGLRKADYQQPIIFGGIGSMFRKAPLFGWRGAMFIDEAHLVNPTDGTMYLDFITALKEINPFLKVIGLTATWYRQGQGLLTDAGGIFTDICYNICTIEGFARLIAEGYLCPLFPRPTNTKLPLDGVGVSGGDYVEKQLEAALDKESITNEALTEALQWGYDRKKWIVFASGVNHAEHIAQWLNAHGVSAVTVHSKKSSADNDAAYAAHKDGKVRCLVGMNKFTTGYDDEEIDFIIMLRPTKSTSLWVQMLGRGTRPAFGKYYCLVLDFARNSEELGPINAPRLPKKKGAGGGDAPVKICDNCGTYNYAAARWCMACGNEFKFETKIKEESSEAPLMQGFDPIIETFPVSHVFYYKHQSRNKPYPTLKVQYFLTGMVKPINEWVNLQHPHPARYFAGEWWRERHSSEPPETIDAALEMCPQLRVPYRVKVHMNHPEGYPKIVGTDYDNIDETRN